MTRSPSLAWALALATFAGFSAPPCRAAIATWDGGSPADSNWTSPLNWEGDVAPVAGDDLVFPDGAARLVNVNDFPPGTTFTSMTFAGGGYTLAGNAMVLGQNIFATSTAVNTLALALDLPSAVTHSVGVQGADLYVGSTLTGAGDVQKSGSGTLRLVGSSPAYSGSLTILSGTVLVNANFASASALVGFFPASLGGTGTLKDIDVFPSGEVSPGTSPGVLSAVGHVAFTLDTFFKVEINGTTAGAQYDQLVAAGNVTLTGAALSVSLGFTPPLSSSYTILQAAGGVTGTFAGLPPLAFLSAGGLTFQVHYNATSVVLVRMDQPGPLQADFSVTKTDGIPTYGPGDAHAYQIVARNAGPAVGAATVTDVLPASFQNVTWNCSASAGSSCAAPSGVGNISVTVDLLVGGTAIFTAAGVVAAGTTGSLVNTATITPLPGLTDPNAANDSATDVDVPRGSFFSVPPCRLIDTRNPSGPFGGPALVAGTSRTFPVTGSCGIPPGATAVVLNMTVVSPTSAGNLRIFPTGTAVPTVSALNYSAGQTRGNNGIFAVDLAGQLDIRCVQVSGTAHVVVDVNGYFLE